MQTTGSCPYADGLKHKSSAIRSRQDLQIPEVVFQFQQTDEINLACSQWTDPFVDAYLARRPGGLQVRSAPSSCPWTCADRPSTKVQGSLTARAIDVTSDAFWEDVKQDLKGVTFAHGASRLVVNPAINDGSPYGITVLDHAGAPVSLVQFPNKLTGGNLAPWMQNNAGAPIRTKEVTVLAYLSYQTVKGAAVNEVVAQPISTRITLTNSAVGTANYTAIASSSQAETPPANLAYLFWSSCNNAPLDDFLNTGKLPTTVPPVNAPENIQWEGEHVIVEPSISQFRDSRYTLCFAGGNPDWAAMNAVIDTIEFDFFYGRTTVTFGPYRHLDQKQFFDLVMMFRTRVAWDNPNVRATGQDPRHRRPTGLCRAPEKTPSTTPRPPNTQHAFASAPLRRRDPTMGCPR